MNPWLIAIGAGAFMFGVQHFRAWKLTATYLFMIEGSFAMFLAALFLSYGWLL